MTYALRRPENPWPQDTLAASWWEMRQAVRHLGREVARAVLG